VKILVMDNYDSFVYNIAQLLGERNAHPHVIRNNMITLNSIRKMDPDAVIISPGPGHPGNPKYFGICNSIITDLGPTMPVLGICLGNQGIAYAFGGKIINAKSVTHGKTSLIKHNNKSELYDNISNPFVATRYHSLVADSRKLPGCLEVTSVSMDDQEIMGLRHKKYAIEGVQFHPESILTSEGPKILLNFLSMVKR
jgi:anthranilate synthase component 2